MTRSTENLRTGLTTGTCAAAAAKAAALALTGEVYDTVGVVLPSTEVEIVALASVERLSAARARASVVKDAGDDPDITNGMTVVVEVERLSAAEAGDDPVRFAAGPGVGTVTKAGLQLAPGEPAINPVPRRMIAAAVTAALPGAQVLVTVSIPGGDEVARRTFNPRLGIEGGLSVLGTSGRVIPKSEDAWLRSLLPQVQLAVADGRRTVYLVPGRFGERVVRDRLGVAGTSIVQCSNFVGDLVDHCVDSGIEEVVIVGHAGKLVKLAAGVWNTHSRYGDARLETVAALAAAAGASPSLVGRLLELPTVEAAVAPVAEAGLAEVWSDVAERVVRRALERTGRHAPDAPSPRFSCAVVGYEGEILGASRLSPIVPDASGASAAGSSSFEIAVVGVGPGAEEWMTPAAWRVIHRAEVVAGGRRQLAAFAPAGAERVVVGASMQEVAAALRGHAGRRIVVLASGDPGFYGIAATLRRLVPEARLTTLPGISSLQLAAARLGRPWNGAELVSAHGLGVEHVVAAVAAQPCVFSLADARTPPQAIAGALAEAGFNAQVAVFERLGEPDERETSGPVEEIARGEFDGLAVVVVQREEAG